MESPNGPLLGLSQAFKELGPGYRIPHGGGGATPKNPSSSELRATAGQLQFYYKIEVKLSQVLYQLIYLIEVMKTEPLMLGSSVRMRSLGDLPSPNH